MEVKTDLAPGDYLVVVDEGFDLLFGGVVVEARVVRVGADGGVNRFVSFT